MVVPTFMEFADSRTYARSYNYLREQTGEEFVGRANKAPRQMFRRRIATELGCPESWDYLVDPHLTEVQATIDGFYNDQAC